MIDFDFHEIAFAVPLLAFSLSALVCGAGPGRGGLGPAAGVRQGGPGLHGRRDRHPDDHHEPARAGAARPGPRSSGGRTAHRVGTGLVRPGHHGDHPALQRAASVPVLGRRRDAEPGRAHLGAVGCSPSSPLLAGPEAAHHAALLLPVAFLALGSPIALVAVPGLALRFVSTNSTYWGAEYHYNATVMPIVFIAAIGTLAQDPLPRPGSSPEREPQRFPWPEPGGNPGRPGAHARHRGGHGLAVPAQRPVAGADVPDQRPRPGRGRRPGPGAGRHHRRSHADPAGPAGGPG